MGEVEIFSINLKFPAAQGIYNSGILATVASFLWYFFILMMVIWVGYSIYAGYKISLSQGDSKEIEGGMTLIKNIWISISWGVIFFIAISIIGSLVGIGNITQWTYQLSQCKNAQGGFYFRDIAIQEIQYIPVNSVYCCYVKNVKSAPGQYAELDFKDGTGHFIGVSSGSAPDSRYFTECEKY